MPNNVYGIRDPILMNCNFSLFIKLNRLDLLKNFVPIRHKEQGRKFRRCCRLFPSEQFLAEKAALTRTDLGPDSTEAKLLGQKIPSNLILWNYA